MDKSNYEIPVALAMALAQNPEAMQKYSRMTNREKQLVREKAGTMHSSYEMKQLVNSIAEANLGGTFM